MTRRWVGVASAVLLALIAFAVVASSDRERPLAQASAADPDQPVVAFIGDSWTAGSGSGDQGGYAERTIAQLGWDGFVLGIGGSGYVVSGMGRPYADRIGPALDTDPDVVVVQGSINETPTDVAVLADAARQMLGQLRAQADPGTQILVVGASYVPGTPADAVDGVNAAVAGAAAAVGLPFVDPAAENWTDPRDPAVWADPWHPDDLGHQRIADRLAPLLRDLVSG
jgi:lysophospholipase L1-like esterase